jgi:C_GCAxxG_C_C family probable redox protein
MFPDRFQAEQAQQILQQHGIDALVQADDAGGMYAGLSLSYKGVRLRVRAEDEERARELLEPGDVVDAVDAADAGAGPEGVPAPLAAAETAVRYFDEGNNCAEAVLRTFAADLGQDDPVVRMATGFGGGMGRAGATCGALSGGAMALGLRFGRIEGDDLAAKNRCYAAVTALRERFAAECGAVDCRQLIGIDLTTEEGRQRARDAGLHDTVCRQCVEVAARLAAEILAAD